MLQKSFLCKCLDGIKFLDSSNIIYFNLEENGIVILDDTKRQIYICPYSEINDAKIIKENAIDVLSISANNDLSIKIYQPVSVQLSVIKNMLLKCLENKEEFFEQYEKEQMQQAKFNANFWNVCLWILGILFLLEIFTVGEHCLSSIMKIAAGLLIFPPSYQYIKKLKLFSTTKKRVWAIIILFIFSSLFAPKTTTAYIKADNTIICSKPDGATGFKKLKVLEEIKVYKDKYKTNGFLKLGDGNWVKEDSIVYENSKEHKLLIEQEKEKSAQEEKLKQEVKEMLLAEQEKIAKDLETKIQKAFVDIDLKDYEFSYYINPLVWYNTNVKEKENVMRNCAIYGKYKTNQKDKELEMALARTKIKSSSNGEVLGEYSLWSGFKFK